MTKKDVEDYGHTEGCVACTMVLLHGRTEIPHDDRCRLRMAELLAETEKGRARLEAQRRTKRGADSKSEDPNQASDSRDAPRVAGSVVGSSRVAPRATHAPAPD